MKKLIAVLCCSFLFSGSLFAAPAKFPSKQITVVVGYSAGGTSDTVTRFIAKEMEAELGVPIIVTNKPGGSSAVAFEYLASRKADGYTLMYVPVENAMVKPLGFTKLEPKDIRYIGRAMTLPATVTVNANSPFKTFADLVKYAKNNPGKLKVGNSGTGSIWHFAAVGIERAAGVKFNHVPFDSGTAAATAVMGGHVDIATVAPGEVKAGVESGKLRVLAIVDNQRSSLYPKVPSFKDLKLNVEIMGWGAFAVPLKTPDEIVQILEAAYKKAVESQAFKDLCVKYGLTPAYLSAADAQKFANEQAQWYQEQIPSLNLR